MKIYEKKVDGVRKLFGTLGDVVSEDDKEVETSPEFDFVGPYYYKAPGGIADAEGNEVIISIEGKQIIPPTAFDIGEVDTDLDELEELVIVDDNSTPEDTSDDTITLKNVYTENDLKGMSKATIAQMASVLGYDGIDTSMTKSAMIEAFLDAQSKDERNTTT